MSDDLPSSGEPGLRPPAPGDLPRPALWSPGLPEAPFDGAQEDTADPPTPARRKLAWIAVALMLLGVALVGVALVATSWTALAVAVLVGVVGVVLALRARIMEDVSVSDSPHG